MKIIYLCKKEEIKYSKIIGESLDEEANYYIVCGNDLEEMNYFNSITEINDIIDNLGKIFVSIVNNLSNESITAFVLNKINDDGIVNQLIDMKLIKINKEFRCINPYKEEYVDSRSVVDVKANIIKSILLCEE